jgi:predicted permease
MFVLTGIMAQILLIGSAFPTAVNSVILAVEFDGDHHFASQTVFTSTVMSAVTVSVIIALTMRFM